ncbi:MAG: ammonium transporter [Acidimicrobiia bacterium]|nr:ammonium transporter [Acidimicrobiia bacterium]
MAAGDIAWILVSSALVLFMTPGLALFYGGMGRAKNVLNMLMMNFFTIAIVTVIWVAVGYTFAFGGSGGGIIGSIEDVGLAGLSGEELLFAMFQMTFAIITPALISGAVAGRMKFSAWVMFTALWALIVYPVVAHWAWEGWLTDLGAIDFAGGLVVHINAGIAALALVLVLGPRKGFPTEAFRPHSLPLTLIGTGILWFGWFGFNAGSAFAADGAAINAMVTTQIGASLGALGWVAAEWRKTGAPTMLGAASGAVAGLVAITPAAGFVGPAAAFVFGLLAGIVCYFAVSLKFRFGYDDSLDVVGVHLVGGIVGSLLLGFLAQASVGGVDGAIFGEISTLWYQFVGVVAVLAFSFAMTWLIAKAVDATVGLRVSDQQESEGLDISVHEERGYVLTDAR